MKLLLFITYIQDLFKSTVITFYCFQKYCYRYSLPILITYLFFFWSKLLQLSKLTFHVID